MDEHLIEETITKPSGEKIIKQYSKLRLLGKGTESECYEIVDLASKKSFAAKIFTKSTLKSARTKQKLKSELRIQSKLSHPNIVKFENFFEDSEKIYLLLELCANKNIYELLRRRKRLTEVEAQCYLAQLIPAVKYLHSMRVVHRDLRLNNLFLSDKMEVKIGDFAYATKIEYDGQRKKSVCGTPNFMAPEVIDGSHSFEADIWSLGVFLYTILIGRPPFHTEKSQSTYAKIKAGVFSYPETPVLSDSCKELINRILVVDYKMRLSLDQILESDFLSQNQSFPKLMGLSTLAAPPIDKNKKKEPKKSDKITAEQFNANVKMNGNVFCGHGADGEVYVKKWIDYTSKYGLGYLLSNGNCGVLLIDGSRIIMNSLTGQVFYMNKGNASEYSITEHPEEMKKKITLLQYFKNFLESDSEPMTGDSDTKLPIYVKKYMKTFHAIVFRLSSRFVQVNFQDHSELTLNCDLRIVTVAKKKGEKVRLQLYKALQSTDAGIIRRLKYTRDAIHNMIKFKN